MRALTGLLLVVALLIGSSTVRPWARSAAGASCVGSEGPGVPSPTTVPAKASGFHATYYGQTGYLRLCPGESRRSVVAYYNSGSLGWVGGQMGQVAYLGTWRREPGQDQPSVIGGDGQRGSPNTGWPRFDRVAIQPGPYVGPGQVAWFGFNVQAPATPGVYRVAIRPLIEGAQWMEDYGVYWEITVLNADGSDPRPQPADPSNLAFNIASDGVSAPDILAVHQGVEYAGAYLAVSVGGDRRRAQTVNVRVGSPAERYCCLTSGPSFDIVTSNTAWATPAAAAPDTWTADTERRELAAHEYVHLWQYDTGGLACMINGPRWLSEGMAESLGYRSLVGAGLIPQANMDVFIRRQLRSATYASLESLESSWVGSANPFAVAYLAVDRLLAVPSPLALRSWCARVGSGEEWHSAFQAAFGESTASFYARFEQYRTDYLR
jgi:hypothetical protein